VLLHLHPMLRGKLFIAFTKPKALQESMARLPATAAGLQLPLLQATSTG
jgi:hypothetical protein